MTLEDGIEVLETTGDTNAFEYGGGVIYRTPNKKVFWQFWEPRMLGDTMFIVYTAKIPDNVLAHYKGVDVDLMCRLGEVSQSTLRRLSKASDPKDRAFVMELICEAHGSSAVDSYQEPDTFTPWELTDRWGPVFGVDSNQVPMIEFDDYLIRQDENYYDQYECGRINGEYIGRFKTYDETLKAVAQYMHENDGYNFNLFHEHEKGQIEPVEWTPEKWVGKKKRTLRRGRPNPRWRFVTTIYSKEAKKRPERPANIKKAKRRARAKVEGVRRLERARKVARLLESRGDR